MKVYGLDFTSSPSSSKLLTLACCSLSDCTLTVESLTKLNTTKEGDYSRFSDWLEGQEPYSDNWIAGIDLPFGMPLEAIERFGWLKSKSKETWESYIQELYLQAKGNVDQFRAQLESWKKSGKTGDDKRVFLLRHTDKLSGFAGSTPSSPMKVHVQCNPPVGRMFFQGADRLRKSGACICPVRPNDCGRIIVEAYPRLVADKFIPGGKYKDGSGLGMAREAIIAGLANDNTYKITLCFNDPDDRKSCISDEKGDKLDSVLCAVQAAWAYNSEQEEKEAGQRTHSFGVPIFDVACMNSIVALEGWIVDPLLLSSIKPK